MTTWPLKSRAQEYRNRAEEVRAKAEATTNASARETLLLAAASWERMAEWEEKNSAPSN